jgi:hypothetical protein
MADNFQKRVRYVLTRILLAGRRCLSFLFSGLSESFYRSSLLQSSSVLPIVRGAVSPDHIHLLVYSLRKRHVNQHLWARGYFCATVSAVDKKSVWECIENQRWDDGESFTRTAPTES